MGMWRLVLTGGVAGEVDLPLWSLVKSTTAEVKSISEKRLWWF